MALVPDKKSGVGVTIENTLEQLLKMPEMKDWKVNLVVTLRKAKYLKRYESANVHIKTIYIFARVLEVLSRTKLLPPVDWFLGRGIYVFPNYRNWPTWKSRSVTYVYDVGYIKHPETVSPKNQRYLERYMPGWLRRTNRVVTISQQVKYEIEKYLGFDESRIDIVPCGVDKSVYYRRNSTEIEAVKKRYGITYDKYFLFVGNIEPRKNLKRLLDAYYGLPAATQKEYGLVFVGGQGWQNEGFYHKLQKMQSEGKNVLKISDYVVSTDLPALYSGAAALVHPAIYEGFGMTPLEAMACGTPVAVADLPVVKEVVQDAGIYFDPYDTAAIVNAIQATLSDAKLVAANVARGLDIASEYSWRHTAHELLNVINREHDLGPRRHPVLFRLRLAYHTLDRKILRLLGERAYPSYVPPAADTTARLRESIIDDFCNEQPTRLQVFAKKIYLGAKHGAAAIVRRGYHMIKAVGHGA